MCEVTSSRYYSHDLAQGGLQLPSKLIFCGPYKELDKVKCLFGFASSKPPSEATANSNRNQPSRLQVKCVSPALVSSSAASLLASW